jgi:hypothetical protein
MSEAKLSEADLARFTDFPAERITLWFENGTIYLPSEH